MRLQALVTSTTALGALALGISLVACSSHSGSTDWSIVKSSNPLNDMQSTTATTRLVGKAFDLDLVVSCSAAGVATYQFRAFDKEKNGEDFQTGTLGGSPVKALQLRLDGGQAFNRTSFTHDFTNQFVLTGTEAKPLASAKQVVVHAPLQHGDETYTLDQSGPDFRAAVQACAEPLASASNAPLPVAASAVQEAPSTNAPGVAEDIPLSNKSDAELGIVPTDEIPVSNSE